MVLVKHEEAGVVLDLEVRGRKARFVLEVVSAPREQRDFAATSLAVFADLLAARISRPRAAVKS